MEQVKVNHAKVRLLTDLLSNLDMPPEAESGTHRFDWPHGEDELANAYFAIVAICHQTSPIGETCVHGTIGGSRKSGWDYLKEKYLLAAAEDIKLCYPDHWAEITPSAVSEIFRDPQHGTTLNRINERCYLLNDIGRRLLEDRHRYVRQAFEARQSRVFGETSFLEFLANFDAYSDPLSKKSFFFLAIAIAECGWNPIDKAELKSPIDYHELRGHLRIGTITATSEALIAKLEGGLPISEDEDIALRTAAQLVNDIIASAIGTTSSTLHYMLWNVFRNCCPRESGQTHCRQCSETCALPRRYKELDLYSTKCFFAECCDSAASQLKIIDPPYLGHYY